MTRRALRWFVPAVPAVALAAAVAGVATVPDDAPARPAEAPAEQSHATPARPVAHLRAAGAGDARAAAAARRAERRAERRRARIRTRRAARRATVRRARTATRAAASRIGSPYVYGATGPGAFDCSGLTSWAMRRAGVRLPRTSFAQASTGYGVKRSKIRRGDLVFFSTAGPGASHVGIATSRSTVISATSSGVMRHAISDGYWGSHYVGARRVATRG